MAKRCQSWIYASSKSYLPVAPNQTRLRSALLVAGERHAQIRPSHTASGRDDLLIRVSVFRLHAERDAARAAPAREVGEHAERGRQILGSLEHHLEYACLFARAPLDERRRVTQRVPNQPARRPEEHRVAEPQLLREHDLAREVVPGNETIHERATLLDRVLVLVRAQTAEQHRRAIADRGVEREGDREPARQK